MKVEQIGNSILFNGDCLEIMPLLINSGTKVDAVIFDPPYSTTRSKWDKILPYDKMWNCIKQLRKDNSAIVAFGNEPFSSELRMSNKNEYRYDWKWVKNHQTGFANSNYRPMNKYEDIMVFSSANASAGGKANAMKYYPQGLVEVNKTKKNSAKRQGLVSYANNNMDKDNQLMQDGSEYTQKYTNYPSNILNFDCETKYLHPTMKPVALMEYLVKTYTNEEEIVLDFTAGSFSTGVACINTNRKFIGIELDEHYFEIGKERMLNCYNEKVKENASSSM